MYNQFTSHGDGLFMIPAHLQAIAEATVGKTRVSYEKMTAPGKTFDSLNIAASRSLCAIQGAPLITKGQV